MTAASRGRSTNVSRDVDPTRSILELATKTPAVGRLGARAASRPPGSGPTLSRTRKWTQPQERKKARMGGGGRVELEEEELEAVEELKGRKVKLPNRRASSRALESARVEKSAATERSLS